jgi:hypothetical protein
MSAHVVKTVEAWQEIQIARSHVMLPK